MISPETSTTVATKGAEALAGSKPRRRMRKGSIEPTSVPQVTMPRRLAATTSALEPLFPVEDVRVVDGLDLLLRLSLRGLWAVLEGAVRRRDAQAFRACIEVTAGLSGLTWASSPWTQRSGAGWR
jgi:hypothetical protein